MASGVDRSPVSVLAGVLVIAGLLFVVIAGLNGRRDLAKFGLVGVTLVAGMAGIGRYRRRSDEREVGGQEAAPEDR